MSYVKKTLTIMLVVFLITGCRGMGTLEKGISNSEVSSQQIETTQNLEEVLDDKYQASGNTSLESEEGETSGIGDSKSRGAGAALTFDDKTILDWYSLRELFSSYDVRATFFVSKSYALTPDEVEMLRVLKEEGHEIGSHSVNHMNANKYVNEHSLDDYLVNEIEPSIEDLENKGFKPKSFAYPFGARSEEIDERLLEEFDVIRGITHSKEDLRVKDIDIIYISPKEDHRLLYAIGIDKIYGNSIEEIEEGLDRAKEEDKVILFYGHAIGENPGEKEYKIDPSDLEKIIKAAYERGLEFYIISELVN